MKRVFFVNFGFFGSGCLCRNCAEKNTAEPVDVASRPPPRRVPERGVVLILEVVPHRRGAHQRRERVRRVRRGLLVHPERGTDAERLRELE